MRWRQGDGPLSKLPAGVTPPAPAVTVQNSAPVLLSSALAGAVLLPVTSMPSLPFPRLACTMQATYQPGALCPKEAGVCEGQRWGQVRPFGLGTPPGSLLLYHAWKPQPQKCHTSGADEVSPNAKQLINSQAACQKPSLLTALVAEISHFMCHHLSLDMNKWCEEK